MKIAIHSSNRGYHPRWIAYCEGLKISYKLVNCYDNNIIAQLADCDALMWHYHQNNAEDMLMAKQLLFSLQQAGKKVFPDFNTAWHFDDKLGQKYLLESISSDLAPTWVFYNKATALAWIKSISFPKVFKLRGGAGSQNVRLVKTHREAKRLIYIAFGRGFKNYDAWGSLRERFRKYNLGKAKLLDVVKGIIRLAVKPYYDMVLGREIGYIYFQEFYPNNDSDTRIIVIGNKAFALKRMVRNNDFRASGSGSIKYEKAEIDERCVSLSFEHTHKLGAQCVAYDYVFDSKGSPKLIEISYGFYADAYDDCVGYWDEKMNWYPGKFNPYGWMVALMLEN